MSQAALNIVIPMAGRGSRFSAAGYRDPKPFIPVKGCSMIELVIENLRPRRPHRFVFLVLVDHLDRYDAARRLELLAPGCVIVPVDAVTEGAACTVLLAKDHLGDDAPLMIANSDQWVAGDIDEYLALTDAEDLDGLIMTMEASDPKWSFVRFDEDQRVTEVVEKVAVSNEATVGIYNFRRGADFVRAAQAMIHADERVNGEFYVAPTYNQLIGEGAHIAFSSVGTDRDGMYGLGTPADLDLFLRSEAARAL